MGKMKFLLSLSLFLLSLVRRPVRPSRRRGSAPYILEPLVAGGVKVHRTTVATLLLCHLNDHDGLFCHRHDVACHASSTLLCRTQVVSGMEETSTIVPDEC